MTILETIPLNNKEGVHLNSYLLELQKIPEPIRQAFAERGWQYTIDYAYLARLSEERNMSCIGATNYGSRQITVSSAGATVHEFGHFLDELMGFPRHLGIHSGGMVICHQPVSEVCPVEWARMPGRTVLQWDKDDCAAAGLVKFDLLGLGMLSALHYAMDMVAEHHGRHVDLGELDLADDEVYAMLRRADAVGVFQVESRAQLATLPRLKPREFYDLVVQVALIRPGPIQGGSVHPYIRRRNGQEDWDYDHPLMAGALAKTLGVPLFQEQLMQLAVDVAGFSPAEADELRRAMGAALEAPEAIAILNKQDLAAVIEPSDLPFSYIIPVSCKDGTGFDLLEQAFDMLFPDDAPCDGSLLTNARQADAILRAKKSVDSAVRSLRAGMAPDAVLVDLEAAMDALGEVTGRTMREDITNRIFERFCVGK